MNDTDDHPIIECPSCGSIIPLDTDLALDIIIDKLKKNKDEMERTRERYTDYSTYEIGNQLIRHLSLYREEKTHAR